MVLKIVIKAVPYVVGAILVGFDFASGILNRRYRGRVHEAELQFAANWSSCADTLVIPLLTISYAVSSITFYMSSLEQPRKESLGIVAWLLVTGVFVFLVFFCGALWALAVDMRRREMEEIVIGTVKLKYLKVLKIMRVASVLIAGILDLSFTLWLGAAGPSSTVM